MNSSTSEWPRRLESPAGIAVQVNANGSIRRMEHGDVVLNLFPASEVEGGPAKHLPAQPGCRDRVDAAARSA